MKAKRVLSAIAIAVILPLGACADALGPTDQGPDLATVLEDEDDGGSRDQLGQPKEQNPLER